MPSPRDSERRKARDAALCSQDEAIGAYLDDALQRGELAAAPSFGKPMREADGWHETPPELRVPFKILRNAGVAPPEIGLFHQRAALRARLAEGPPEPELRALQQRLVELEQALAMRLERLRATGQL